MSVLQEIGHDSLNKALKQTFPSADIGEIKDYAGEHNNNNNSAVFKVKLGNTEREFLLFKVSDCLEKQPEHLNVILPLFTLRGYSGGNYGAYEIPQTAKMYKVPQENSSECLKIILKSLAEYQATDLVAEKSVRESSEYNLNEFISLECFEDFDTEKMTKSIDNLQASLNKLLRSSNVLVKSISSPFVKNIYLDRSSESSIFFKLSSNKLLPPVYDVLIYIFTLTDEEFRQKNFKYLLEFYFEYFNEKLASEDLEKITLKYFEVQVRILLPIIKFQIASSVLSEDLMLNISRFIAYPLINQEDIYEAAENVLKTNDYKLLDFSLVQLAQKNGHLGEYFHLDIKVDRKGQEQTMQLFVKFLISNIDWVQKIVESGASKKEEFFYNTLIPLYRQHGLYTLLDFAPNCYLTRINWLVVLDDLIKNGYTTLTPNVLLGIEGLQVTIENLAKFHSATYILEELFSKETGRTIRIDDIYGNTFEETIYVYEDSNPLKGLYDSTLKSLLYLTEKAPEATRNLNMSVEELHSKLKEMYFTMFTKFKKSDTIRNTILHGDIYVGNMLLKYDTKGTIKKGFLVDFQNLKYASPNMDLLFFLYVSSSKETRDQHFQTLVEYYYECLSANLRSFYLDPDIIIPKKTFFEDVESRKSATLMGAFNYISMIQLDPDLREELFEDQEKMDYHIQNKNTLIDLGWKNERYRRVMVGVLEDAVRLLGS